MSINKGESDVFVQDQFTTALNLKFLQTTAAPTPLLSAVTVEDLTIDVTTITGFIAGATVGLVSGTGEFYFGQQIGAIAGNTVTLDTPIDFAFPTSGTLAFPATDDLSVDGSSITQIFQIGPIGETIEVDITRMTGLMLDTPAMDDTLFGGIPALTNGIVLRRNNGDITNYWNAKSNGELRIICGNDLTYPDKIGGGLNGTSFRNTFAGKDKHGVTIRLMASEILQLLIQDDLTGLSSFKLVAQGHIVD